MSNIRKEAIVLLFLNVLFVQSRTVLKTHIVNDKDSLLTQKTEGSDLNLFKKQTNEIKTSSPDIKAYNYIHAGTYTSQIAPCRCENGKCEKEGAIEVCKCPHGYGNYSYRHCRACDCGPGVNCIFTEEYRAMSKVCLCPPGYGIQDKKCVDCECGPDSSCTFTKLTYNKFKKECHCNEGYREENEKCVANPCTSNPCKNGGNCIDSEKGFTCDCVKPYTGPTCETSPCSKEPCQNGGICKVGKFGFTCKCKPPFTGPKCETDPCSSNPCQNGGRCGVNGESFECECKAPYKGEMCEDDPCSSNPCQNGGRCGVNGESFECECKAPYKGEMCEDAGASGLQTGAVLYFIITTWDL